MIRGTRWELRGTRAELPRWQYPYIVWNLGFKFQVAKQAVRYKGRQLNLQALWRSPMSFASDPRTSYLVLRTSYIVLRTSYMYLESLRFAIKNLILSCILGTDDSIFKLQNKGASYQITTLSQTIYKALGEA